MRHNIKKIIALVTTLSFLLVLLVFPVSATDMIPHDSGYLRFIEDGNMGSLASNSKWRESTLYSYLSDTINDDLADSSDCAQVWVVKSEDFNNLHDWCQNKEKGTATIQAFLSEFEATLRTQ